MLRSLEQIANALPAAGSVGQSGAVSGTASAELPGRVCGVGLGGAAENLSHVDYLSELATLHVTQQLQSLRDGSFLRRREYVLLFGIPDSGKCHALCATAEQLIDQGCSLSFTIRAAYWCSSD